MGSKVMAVSISIVITGSKQPFENNVGAGAVTTVKSGDLGGAQRLSPLGRVKHKHVWVIKSVHSPDECW